MIKKILLTTALASSLLTNLKAQNVIQVSTFAGSGTAGSNDATGTLASFNYPAGVCADAAGNIYVADQSNNKIRKITPAGVVTTFAGLGANGFANGQGTAAAFLVPKGLCADAAGNIYVADYGNHEIRKITPAGLVTTFAGTGRIGNIDGPIISAKFSYPSGVCADAAGNIYVADTYNHKIRKITPAGLVSTLAGTGSAGNIDGPATSAKFNYPSGVCVDASGNIYVADASNHKIRKITPSGAVSTLAGTGSNGNNDGPGIAAKFYYPSGVCVDASGNIYVADAYNDKIRKITPSGAVSTLAGTGSHGSNDGLGTVASFYRPSGICADAAGNIYVGDSYNNKIRKIQEVPPAPPAVNYVNLPASVCMGSTVDQSATTTGSSLNFNLNFNTKNITGLKAICKNDSFVFVLNSVDDGLGNLRDTIREYDFSGILKYTYGLNDNKNKLIAADNNNHIYGVYPDNSNPLASNIRRINLDITADSLVIDSVDNTTHQIVKIDTIMINDPIPNNWVAADTLYNFTGFSDFSFSIPSYVLDSILAIEIGPNGNLYVTEKASGYIREIDVTTANITNLPTPSPQHGFDKVVDIAFDKAGDMYLADIGLNKILKRNSADNNYYPAVPGLDTLLMGLNSIDMDTSGIGTFLFSSKTSPSPISLMQAQAPFNIIDSSYYQNALAVAKPKATLITNSGVAPFVWALDTVNNQLKFGNLYAYSITPPLPTGLSYNYITGAIFGKALAPSPLTNYTVSVGGVFGTTNSTFAFEVATTNTLSNTNGTSSTIGNQADGLTVKYFSPNNCSKMIEIADSLGGTQIGKVEVKETVSNLATFSSGNFVGRVTEVNAQNPNASAVLRLFFTYQDIQNYNAANGTGIDLSNDTIGKTMTVAVLQLHKDSTGHIEQIQHNPITANWITAEHNWKVEFPVTKFSTFYTGQATEMETFTCADSTQSSVTANNYYVWHNDSLTTSGTYYNTLINKNGCDSVLKLNLTINITTGFNEAALASGISVFPNPSNGVFNIKFNNAAIMPAKARVISVIGTEVLNKTITSNDTVDLSSFQSGIYYLILESEGTTKTWRIVKQ